MKTSHKLTAVQRRALLLVSMSAAFGRRKLSDDEVRAYYAIRPDGSVYGHLARVGLIDRPSTPDEDTSPSGWRLTPAGRAALEGAK